MSDPKQALAQARIAAVTDAKSKAQLYATAAGVRLGALVELSDRQNAGAPISMSRQASPMIEADIPIAAGVETITATVFMTFSIVP